MTMLRFFAWVALLIIVISIAYALFAFREITQQAINLPAPSWTAPSYVYRPICKNTTYIDPWTVVNYFGLSIENNRIVFKYTNTTEEATKVLSNASIDPKTYYYYYSILTALVAIHLSNYTTVYDLHPLPVSRNNSEGLANLSLCIYLPKGFEVPKVNASLATNTSYVARNVTVYVWDPALRAYVPRNKTEIINIVTYLPTASIAIANSTRYVNAYNVTGFATGSLSVERVGETVCGNTTAYFADYNAWGYIVYMCSVYNISYSISLGYEINGSKIVTDSYTGSTVFTASNCGGGASCTSTVASFEGASYKGFKPLAKATIDATSFYAYSETKIVNGTPYLYEHYYASFKIDTYTRTLRIYKADVAISTRLGKVLTGVLSTMRLIIDANGSRAVLPINISKPIVNASVSAYPWESRGFNASIYLGDVVSIAGSRIINFTRTVKVASISMGIDKPSADLSMYPWNTVIDVKPVVSIRTWSIRAPSINITRVQQLLTPNPGEVWLQRLVLRYIHDRIKQFIESNSAMDQYFDAYMWLLSAEIPSNMGNCSKHDSVKPLLDALCDKCGSEAEKAGIVCNITSYSLSVNITRVGLYYPTYNVTLVNATVCIARIGSYPPLWSLYNTSTNSFYAKPIDSGYLVFYNAYENSVFGDWRRVKE